MNSGFLVDTDFTADSDMAFGEVEMISQSSTHFIACCTRYGRRWILKGLRPDAAGDALARQQLFKEFKILSMLSHPGIVRFAGLEEIGPLGLCIVMEWIDGTTLEDALREGSLTRSDRRRLLTEITDAVACLHSVGIVHRDLKPSNIMVRRNGSSAVIIDFGLADTDAFTIVKYPAGTLGYASERQQHATTPDTSDDIYSLGVIMRQLYPAYGAIARRCVAREGRRYRDGSQLLQALRRRARLPRRLAFAAIAVAVMAAGGALALHNLSLRSSFSYLDGQLTALRQENEQQTIENRQQQSRLTDTITLLKSQLAEEAAYRTVLEQHEAYVDSLKKQLKKQCLAAFAKFQKEKTGPVIIDGYHDQNLHELMENMGKLKEDFYSAHKDLTDVDRMKIEDEFGTNLSEIIRKYNILHEQGKL